MNNVDVITVYAAVIFITITTIVQCLTMSKVSMLQTLIFRQNKKIQEIEKKLNEYYPY